MNKDPFKGQPITSMKEMLEAAWLAAADAVCIPNCRETFDGKHAAWCPARIAIDHIRALADRIPTTYAEPTGLIFGCYRCLQPLNVPGGLLFSPPGKFGNVSKYHLCVKCYDNLTQPMVVTQP